MCTPKSNVFNLCMIARRRLLPVDGASRCVSIAIPYVRFTPSEDRNVPIYLAGMPPVALTADYLVIFYYVFIMF